MRSVKKKLFSNQRTLILIPSSTHYRTIFQNCVTRMVSYWHVQSESLFWELHEAVFWGLPVWWNVSKSRLWLDSFLAPRKKSVSHWEHTTDRDLKWTHSSAHKSPASLTCWWTWKPRASCQVNISESAVWHWTEILPGMSRMLVC